MQESNLEWVSASTLATRLNVTPQTIYNRIAKGMYPSKEFVRGKMRGILVGVNKEEVCV